MTSEAVPIPHKPPFLFVDKVIEKSAEHCICERLVRENEPHFAGHYPGNPIMPGVLLCEACFQAASVFLIERIKAAGEDITGKTPILARIENAKFRQLVKPGDTLRIEVRFKETVSGFNFMTGKITVDGKTAMTCTYALALK